MEVGLQSRGVILPKKNNRTGDTYTETYKCQPCRKAKRKCLPEIRAWPAKCNDCLKRGLECSQPMLKNGDVFPQIGDDCSSRETPTSSLDETRAVKTVGSVVTNQSDTDSTEEWSQKRRASTDLQNPAKHLRRQSSHDQEFTGDDYQAQDTLPPSANFPLKIHTNSSLLPDQDTKSPNENIPANFGPGCAILPDLHRPIMVHPDETLNFSDAQYDGLSLNELDLRKRTRSAADVLNAMGQSSAAFSVYLTIYIQSSQKTDSDTLVGVLRALCHSVTTRRHAEIVRRILDYLTPYLLERSDLTQEEAKRFLHTGHRPTLISLSATLNLRAFAALPAGARFSLQKAEEWATHLRDAVSLFPIPAELPSDVGLGIKNINCLPCEPRQQPWYQPPIIAQHRLKQSITQLELFFKDSFSADTRFLEKSSRNFDRVKAVQDALEQCTLEKPKRQGHQAGHGVTPSPFIFAREELYLLLYSKIWDSLQASLQALSEDPYEKTGGSVAEVADVTTRDMLDNILSDSKQWKPEYWEESWQRKQFTTYANRMNSSDSILYSLLHRADYGADKGYELAQGFIFDFLLAKFDVDVRAIIQGTPSDPEFASGKLDVPARAIIQVSSPSRPVTKPSSASTEVLHECSIDHPDHSSLPAEDTDSSSSKRHEDHSSGQIFPYKYPSITSLNAPYTAHAPLTVSAASEIPTSPGSTSRHNSQSDIVASSYDSSRLLPPSDKILRSSSFSTTAVSGPESQSHDGLRDQLNELYLFESHTRRTSVLSMTSSFQQFKKLLSRSFRYSAASQEMLAPSAAIRRSQRSDWSLVFDSLSQRFSKASISTKNSRFSKIETRISEDHVVGESILEHV